MVALLVLTNHKLIQDIGHCKITHEEALKKITSIRNDIKRIDDLSEFNQNQVNLINALFIVDEIFTGGFKLHKMIDGKCKLLKSKSDQKESYLVRHKNLIQKCLNNKLKIKKRK